MGTPAPPRRSSLHHCRRFLFYCNEMVGLGHLRRTLTIADRLAQTHDDVTSLVITGCPVESIFGLPPRTETVKLPVRTRDAHGHARSRLVLELEELRALRGQIALAVATAFDPDVAVVDKLPLGVDGELEPTLRALRGRDGRCKLVLGLRDIDDSPANVRRKWGVGMREAILRYYDAILVYGPASTPDAIACMGWSRLDVPVLHVGYVGAPMPATGPDDLPDGYLLATSGAGHDGFELLATLGEAIRAEPLPCDTVMVAGPLRDPDKLEQLRRLTMGLPVRLYAYRTDLPHLIVGARAVVSMAGYNTVGDIMRTRKPALLVPRVRPSEEQLIRAQRLKRRGLQQMLHPADVGPATLRAELDTLLARPAPPLELADYTGAERTVDVLAAMAGLGRPRPAAFPAARRPASTRQAGVMLVHAAALRVRRGTAALHQRHGEHA